VTDSLALPGYNRIPFDWLRDSLCCKPVTNDLECPPLLAGSSASLGIDMTAVVDGRARLSPQQAMELYRHASLTDLGQWATQFASRVLDSSTAWSGVDSHHRTYVIDRNINYTNVCSADCTFCAFKRDLGHEQAYTLTTEQLHKKISELRAVGGTQILLQGGMHPELPIAFYEDMLRSMKRTFPTVHIHGFSPPEIVEFVAIFDIDGFPVTAPGHSHELGHDVWHAKLDAILRRLMAAGLDSIPGGGGEIFAHEVRRRIGLGKAAGQQWLDVMSAGHRMGMRTSATMMFGHVEGVADRIAHIEAIRAAQDLAIRSDWPGRYVSFIAWPFQRENTPLGRLREWDVASADPFPGDVLAEKGIGAAGAELAGKRLRMAGATDYLRTQAIARLMLDNIHSIGASWVTMGPKIGQMALFYGATDMGSVMMEENVVSAAGTTYCLSEELICHLIRQAGFVPAQRDNAYRALSIHDGPDSPDLLVKDWSTLRATKLHQEHVSSGGPAGQKSVSLTIASSERPAPPPQ
jgi:cyclic dehypoxanthinyl futalosine synthase